MPTFSKFITNRKQNKQVLDSDGYIYSRKKARDTLTQPSPLLGGAADTTLLRSVPATATSPCPTTRYPSELSPTTILLTWLLHRDEKSSPPSSGKLQTNHSPPLRT